MITMDAKAGKGAYWLEADGKRSRIWTLGTLELDATLETIIETLARALRARGYRLGIVLAERGLGGLHVSAGSYEIAPNTYGADLGGEEYRELDYLGQTYQTSSGPATCPDWARRTA
jgi:hypothetical protein